MARFPLKESPLGVSTTRLLDASGLLKVAQLPPTVVTNNAPTAVFADNFQRADTALGTIGPAQIGAWGTITGAGVAAAKVTSNSFGSSTGTVYAPTFLPALPGRTRAVFALNSGAQTFAHIWSADATTLLANMLHCIVTQTGVLLTTWTPLLQNVTCASFRMTWSQQATLSGLLSTGGAITTLPVVALPAALASGRVITVRSGPNSQTWTLTAAAAAGATSLAVTSQTPSFAFPIGSAITVEALPVDGSPLLMDEWVDVVGATAHVEVSDNTTGALLLTADAGDPLIPVVAGPQIIWEPVVVGAQLLGAYAYPPNKQAFQSGQVDVPAGISAPIGIVKRALGFFSRVGVGTSSPGTDLEIVQTDPSGTTTSFGVRVLAVLAHANLKVQALTSGYYAGVLIENGGTGAGGVGVFRTQLYNGAYVSYFANAGSAGTPINRWSIDQSGVENHMTTFYLPTPAAASQTATATYAGTGVPSGGANGDIYFRSDGGAGTTIYQKRAGTWVGII